MTREKWNELRINDVVRRKDEWFKVAECIGFPTDDFGSKVFRLSPLPGQDTIVDRTTARYGDFDAELVFADILPIPRLMRRGTRRLLWQMLRYKVYDRRLRAIERQVKRS